MGDNCPFCDKKQFEERLIAEVDGFYLIATLGQITDGGYVLLVPKEHILCIGELSKKRYKAMFQLIRRVNHALFVEYKLDLLRRYRYPITLFEHGIVGQTVNHAHIHILPKMINLTSRIRTDFQENKIEELEYLLRLKELYNFDPRPYLLWASGRNDGYIRVCWNPPAPTQYLRIVAAQLLDRPERANWRTMDAELDRKLWSETVERLKPYFQ